MTTPTDHTRFSPSMPVPERLMARRRITDSDCWEWTGATSGTGYGILGLQKKKAMVHRLAASLWLGFDLASPLMVCHHCDNPLCFNPEHLFIGDRIANLRDSQQKGRQSVGERHYAARLTANQVREIRASYVRDKDGEAGRLALIYGVAAKTVREIACGRKWKSIL